VSPDAKDLYFVRGFPSFHVVPLADAGPTPQAAIVQYVANAGVRVDVEGRRFLVDAVFRDGLAPYATLQPDARTRLESARGEFADIDAVLVTHWHEDHFDAKAVAAHLRSNAKAVLISSPEVVSRVRQQAPALPASRLRGLAPAPGGVARTDVAGVAVHVLRVRHNPTRRLPEQHVAFLIGSRAPVLHVGDADPVADNFAALRALPRVDQAVLPFWYVLDEASRVMVAAAIRPRHIVAVHVPPVEAERVARTLREAGVHDVTVPAREGS
jgi:L-ascorbate metabolism protein UlaG (beta-lactamase superfamily)